MSSKDPNRRQGHNMEQEVARKYDLDHRPDETDWYDAVNPSTGTKYEVKSTHQTYANGADGRYRLWQDQHQSLKAAAGTNGQTAYYAFVLMNNANDVVDIVRKRPPTITRILHENGYTWNQAGHMERRENQFKLPYPLIHD